MRNSSTGGKSWLGAALPAVLVAAAAAAVYLNSLHAPFHYDDYETVLTNKNIRIFSDLPSILLHSPFRGVLFLSFALSYRLTGADPFGFHLVNLLLHALNAVLVFALGRALVRRTGDAPDERHGPALAGLLFAVHPALTEAVTYVSSRSSLLATTFYLCCVLGFVEGAGAATTARRLLLYGASFAAFLLGLLTKELLATAPITLLIVDRLFVSASGDRKTLLKRLAFPHLPFLLVIAAGGAARLVVFMTREVVAGSLPRGIAENLATQAQVVVVYLRLIVAPFGLTLMHDFHTVHSFWEFPTPIAAAFLALLVWAGVRVSRRDPMVAFAILWWFVALLPSSSFIPFQEAMAEHHLYLPAAGLLLAIGVPAARLINRLGERRSPWRGWAIAGTAAVLALFAILTVARNQVWRDELRLWRDTVDNAPATWATHYGYGDALRRDAERRQGDMMALKTRGDQGSARLEYVHSVKSLRDAVEQYTLTLVYRPDHPDALLNRGICHAMIAQVGGGTPELDLAYADFRRVIELEPANTKALNNMGNLALIRGDVDSARDRYLQVIGADPNNLNAHVNLGSLYLNRYHDRAAAYRHYYQAYQVLVAGREFERARALYRMLQETGTAPPQEGGQ